MPRRFATALLWGMLLIPTWAAAQPVRAMQIYDQVQGMRDSASALIDAKHPDAQRLAKAEAILRQAKQVLATPEAVALGEGDTYLASRRSNVNQDLAEVLALQGRKDEALDALDAVLADYWYGPYVDAFENDPALASLHTEPRFQAFLATLRANNRLWADTAFAVPAGELPDEAHRIAGLSLFWSQAKYNFVYFDRVPDLDWDEAYLDALPKVIAARSLHAYYDALMRLAPLLHDGHTNIYPPVAIEDQFYSNPSLTTDLVEGRVLVVAVNSDRVAAAGVRVGDEITDVDGIAVHRYAEQRVAPYASSATAQDRAVRIFSYQLLNGDRRRPVRLELLDPSGHRHTATLSREPDPQARPHPMFQWRLLANGVAYLSLDEFADDRAVHAFEHAWPEIRRARGLILDVRRNGGGSSKPGAVILSYLSKQSVPSEHSTTRVYSAAAHANGDTWMVWHDVAGSGKPFKAPHAEHFEGPVAVLIGPRTFSAAEDFVVSFAVMRRGILVGEPTGGSTGNPLQFDLPGGGRARICAKRDTYPDGRSFVGKGIEPDIRVPQTVADIRAGRDRVLERAVTALENNRQHKSSVR